MRRCTCSRAHLVRLPMRLCGMAPDRLEKPRHLTPLLPSAMQAEEFAKMNKKNDFTVVTNLKDMLAKKRLERQLLAAKGLIQLEKPPEEDGPSSGGKGMGGKSGYVPPHLRNAGGAGGESMSKKRRELRGGRRGSWRRSHCRPSRGMGRPGRLRLGPAC